MALLEAIVAFALAMLLFSTVVSAIIEVIIHRIFKLRQRGFRQLLENLYDQVLIPRLRSGVESLSADYENRRRQFVDAIVARRGVRPEAKKPTDGSISEHGVRVASRTRSAFTSRQVSTLNAVEFVERMADTDIGRMIAAQGRVRRDALIDDIALKFERFADGTRDYFTERSRTISVFVAIALAFAVNIEVTTLFEGFLKDPAARASFLARADAITENYTQTLSKPAAPKAPESKPAGSDDAVREMQALASDVKSQLAQLDSMELAIGRGYFPWCEVDPAQSDNDIRRAKAAGLFLGKLSGGNETLAATADDPRCRKRFSLLQTTFASCLADAKRKAKVEADRRARLEADRKTKEEAKGKPENQIPSEAVMRADCVAGLNSFGMAWDTLLAAPWEVEFEWVLFCLTSGFLIGLGGPFWFNVFSNLNRVMQVARQIGGVFARKPEGPEPDKAQAAGGARKPASPVEAFARASEINSVSVGATGRDDWSAWRARVRGGIPWTRH